MKLQVNRAEIITSIIKTLLQIALGAVAKLSNLITAAFVIKTMELKWEQQVEFRRLSNGKLVLTIFLGFDNPTKKDAFFEGRAILSRVDCNLESHFILSQQNGSKCLTFRAHARQVTQATIAFQHEEGFYPDLFEHLVPGIYQVTISMTQGDLILQKSGMFHIDNNDLKGQKLVPRADFRLI